MQNKRQGEENRSLTSVSLCVAERLPVIALEPFGFGIVFPNLSFPCLPVAPLVDLLSATVPPFFVALSSFFGAFAVSLPSA